MQNYLAPRRFLNRNDTIFHVTYFAVTLATFRLEKERVISLPPTFVFEKSNRYKKSQRTSQVHYYSMLLCPIQPLHKLLVSLP